MIAFFVGTVGSIFFDRIFLPYLSSLPKLSFLSKLTSTSPIVINRREQIQIDEGVNLTDLAKQAGAYTVSIYTGDKAALGLAGAGVILTSDGVIFTSRNVVGAFKEVTVVLNDGRSFPGLVRALDSKSELAVVTIAAGNLSVAQFNDANNLQIGQRVFGLGTTTNEYTKHFNSGIVTRNVVNGSSFERIYSTELLEESFEDSATASRDFIGGPIVDIEGKVVGFFADQNGKIISSEGLNQALSSYLTTGKILRPYWGIKYYNYSKTLGQLKGQKSAGALVAELEEASPARKAGLKIGDYITAVDGTTIDSVSFERLINRHQSGSVKLLVVRDGSATEITFNLENK